MSFGLSSYLSHFSKNVIFNVLTQSMVVTPLSKNFSLALLEKYRLRFDNYMLRFDNKVCLFLLLMCRFWTCFAVGWKTRTQRLSSCIFQESMIFCGLLKMVWKCRWDNNGILCYYQVDLFHPRLGMAKLPANPPVVGNFSGCGRVWYFKLKLPVGCGWVWYWEKILWVSANPYSWF